MFQLLQPARFEFEGLPVRGWVGGQGFPLLLLHGSGPGASSVGNWRAVLDSLAARYRVLALDLVGFGDSALRPVPPYFDIDLWQRQVRFGIDLLAAERVGLVGHSLSAALALRAAARDPRIAAVLTTGAMGTAMPVNEHLADVWRCPRDREAMRRTAETLIHDRSLVTDEYLDARMRVIGSDAYRRYFDAMFERPYVEYIEAARVADADLVAIRCPVMLLHGRNDRAFPAEHTSRVLVERLAHADLLLLGACSHSVAMERPAALLGAAHALFG